MTIMECLERVDTLRPNAYTKAEKLAWINALEVRLYTEVVLQHEGWDGIALAPYTEDTPDDTLLMFKPPHDEMYLYYLLSMIALFNGELLKYQNDHQLFNEAYKQAAAAYTRQVMPRQRVTHFRM